MEIKKIKELMFKAFKEGQKTPDETEGIIKLWINSEIIKIANSGGKE